MRREIFARSPFSLLFDALVPVLFTLAIIAVILSGMEQAKQSTSDEGLRLLTEGLQRASTKCYTVEGAYPETLAYLEEHYGIFIDRTRYEVFYTIFASNFPPDITIIPRQR